MSIGKLRFGKTTPNILKFCAVSVVEELEFGDGKLHKQVVLL